MTATANRTRTGRPAPRRRGAHGFTYLGLIILVTIIGLVGAASLKVGSLMQRAAAEEELLSIGAAFSDALRSYAAATPPGQPQQPPTLQELLKDPRFPGTRRHLRKIFVDPITGKAEWGIMYIGDKQGVIGVYSLSDAPPLKAGNFDARFLNMENKSKLSEWKFTMSSQTIAPQEPMAAPGQNQPGQAPLFPPAEGAAKPPEPAPSMPPPAPVQDPAVDGAAPPPEEAQPEKVEPEPGKLVEPVEPVEPPQEDQSGTSGQEGDGKDGAAQAEGRRDERQRDDGRRNEPKREM